MVEKEPDVSDVLSRMNIEQNKSSNHAEARGVNVKITRRSVFTETRRRIGKRPIENIG
jgi:hypothetical protein